MLVLEGKRLSSRRRDPGEAPASGGDEDLVLGARLPDESGASRRECVLSTETARDVARTVDWDDWTPDQIVEALGGRYRLSDVGRPLAITVEPPPAPDEDEDEDDEASEATAAEARS